MSRLGVEDYQRSTASRHRTSNDYNNPNNQQQRPSHYPQASHGRSNGYHNSSSAQAQRAAQQRQRRRTARSRDSGDELLQVGREEVIQVDLPLGGQQDDGWGGDNATCVTGNTSERSASFDDLSRTGSSAATSNFGAKGFGAVQWGDASSCGDGSGRFLDRARCLRCCSFALAFTICLIALLSPICMITLPKITNLFPSTSTNNDTIVKSKKSKFQQAKTATSMSQWSTTSCSSDCEGQLISFGVKCLILIIGSAVLFGRRFSEALPRLFFAKWLVLTFVFLITFAYWLFYGVRIVQYLESDYGRIIAFSQTMLDSLLFIHYLSVIIFELRFWRRRDFKMHILRSPDGQSDVVLCPGGSVQTLASFVLRHYYSTFQTYNPFLERLPTSTMARMRKARSTADDSTASGPISSFKVYDLDHDDGDAVAGGGAAQLPSTDAAQAIMASAARKRDSAYNERFYDELDWERRVKKRRARLLTAAEEAFGHVKRLNDEKGPCTPMDVTEAAQNVFASLARSLQKYLRITRQQTHHTADQVIRHLAQCLTYDMSPKAFLERFFVAKETHDSSQLKAKWSLVCPTSLSANIQHGSVFQLRCHCPGPDAGVSLLCTVSRLPFLDLTEEQIDLKYDNKFVLRLNSETSV